MKSTVASAVVALCLVSLPAFAAMPPQEAALLNTLSKYNEAYDQAPNEIQQDRVSTEFARRFCAEIPRGTVHDWIGTLETVLPTHHPSGVQITIGLPDRDLYSGSLGIGLSVGNSYGYGVTRDGTTPAGSLLIRAGTPLYHVVSKIPDNDYDRVSFSGRFVPFVSSTACEKAIHYATYFDAIRFYEVRDLGPDK